MKNLIFFMLAVAAMSKRTVVNKSSTGFSSPSGTDIGGANNNISLGGGLPDFDDVDLGSGPAPHQNDRTVDDDESEENFRIETVSAIFDSIEDADLGGFLEELSHDNNEETHDEQSADPNGDERIDVWNGEDDNSLADDEMLTKEQMLELGFVEVKAQPDFLRRFGVTGPIIAELYPEDPQDFVEFSNEHPLTVFDSENEDRETKLWVRGMKAGDFCFIKFRIGGVQLRYQRYHKFFFHCAKILTPHELFVRVLKEECMEPEVKEPNPPVVEKCKWFFKKVEASYEFTVREMGPFNGGDLMDCYVESVKRMTRQPRVEILCSKGAIEDEEYMTLTREDLEKIKANHSHNGDNTFTGDLEETEVTKVKAD